PEHAVAGFELVSKAGAGRCGFVIAGACDGSMPADAPAPEGLAALSSVVRITGPYADSLRRVVGGAGIAEADQAAAMAAATAPVPVVTLDGELFRGACLVTGGQPKEARGILETKREIRDLRARIDGEREALARLAAETSELEASIGHATQAIVA